MAEFPTGKVKATNDTDRKPIVLARVRRYLTTGEVGQPTCIPAAIVREESPPARLGPRDRLTIAGTRSDTRASCGCSAT